MHGFDAARDFALPEPASAGLLWCTPGAASSLRHHPSLPPRACFGAHPARLWLSSLSKILAAALLWCMGLTRHGTSHCPNPPPRACFGAHPARHQAFGIIQTRLRGLALVHTRRGIKPSASNPPPRACFGAHPVRHLPSASSKPVSACLLWSAFPHSIFFIFVDDFAYFFNTVGKVDAAEVFLRQEVVFNHAIHHLLQRLIKFVNVE